jgi:hypothetical protein
LDEKYINNISLFPTDTIFIIEEGIALCINNEYNNYTLLAIVNYHYLDFLELKRNYYITIGKKMDDTMNNFLSILVVFSILASILSVYIMNRMVKRIDQDNLLNIHALIIIILYILMVMNASIGISFLIFKDKSYMFSTEYVTILMYSLYKSVFFTTMFIILLGHGTITFDEWGTLFKKLNKKILLYDLIFSIIIEISLYFIYITSKLKLFYIKDLSEYFPLLCFIIYCIFKKLIPFKKQLDYERRMRPNLVECIKFKLKRYFSTIVIMAVYSIFFLISPLIEYKFSYFYLDNYNIHLILQIVYETFFFMLLFRVFYPQNLPGHYLEDVIFTYKTTAVFLAKIGDKRSDNLKNDKRFNISKLKYNTLEKLSKKQDQPILLMNPFMSSKQNFELKELHIGNVKRG